MGLLKIWIDMEVERDREAAPTWGRAEEELGRGNRAGGGGGGSGDPEDPAAAAADEGEGSLDQTGFLLQRLKDLKRWQKEQEMRLLRDQQRQMEELQRGRRSDEGTCRGAVRAMATNPFFFLIQTCLLF